MMIMPNESAPSYALPPIGDNPSTLKQGTTPGSFANKGRIGTPWTYSSPDTPGMPRPSEKTAWDFLPEGWSTQEFPADATLPADRTPRDSKSEIAAFKNADGKTRFVDFPKGFTPITQLEHARLGVITPQMQRVSEREPHLTAEQVRDEVAAGRMVIPANKQHLKYNLDPMAI